VITTKNELHKFTFPTKNNHQLAKVSRNSQQVQYKTRDVLEK